MRDGGSSIENAAILHRSGVQVCVIPSTTGVDLGGIAGRDILHLPIEAGLKYHSIIAQRKPELPLQQSDDGLVPYWSAHLPGALSEKVIISGHSVQETPQAVLEVRRILHRDIDDVGPVVRP